MKKFVICLFFLISIVSLTIISSVKDAHTLANNTRALPGHTGSPGDGKSCTTTGCHVGTASPQVDWISSDIPSEGFLPNTTYTITATATQDGINKFGFQVSPQNVNGDLLGTLISTDGRTQLNGNGKYITHTASGTAGSNNSNTWQFQWTSPPEGTNEVTFYGAFNAANGNNAATGDQIHLSTLTVNIDPTLNIENSFNRGEKFLVYPTLVKSSFNLGIELEHPSEITVKVIDITGKILIDADLGKLSGKHLKKFDCSSFAPGCHLVVINKDSKSIVEKIFVQ